VSAARLAQVADTEAVAQLMSEFRDWVGSDAPDDRSFRASAERLLGDADTEFLLCGDPPDAVCQVRYRFSIWTATDDCCLEDLFVRDRSRGQGLGRALVAAVLERARARGCAPVEVDTNERNAPALALYESFGFRASTRPGEGRNLLLSLRL
jgi:GNAT superfamily N-acetyltransferase